MVEQITWEELERRRRQPCDRLEALDSGAEYVLVEYRAQTEDAKFWITVHTGGNEEKFEIEYVRKGEPMLMDAAKSQAHEIAVKRGIGLVVIKG